MTQVNDFFRSRIDQMIDLRLPLAVLASRMPWQEIEASLAHNFARKVKAGKQVEDIGCVWSKLASGWRRCFKRKSPTVTDSLTGVIVVPESCL
jgi:hypothetical protein